MVDTNPGSMESNEAGSPREEDTEMGSPRREAMEVGNEMARMINSDAVDNVQTPISHEKDNHVEGFENKSSAPVIGMRFETEDEAYYFYNAYAWKKGFKIRKEYFHKSKDGTVRRRKFSCSREGHGRKDRRGINVRRNGDSTRTGCSARMIIKMQADGLYTVVEFEDNHNHQCNPNKAYIFSSQMQISIAQAMQGKVADNIGTRPKATIDFMSAEAEGSENAGFLSRDCKNYLLSKRMRSMIKGDAGNVLQYLENMFVEDPGSMYKIQLDEDDQISNIFWADSKMVIDYHAFGDVVCFDMTYRTHNYDRPFAPFVGVNHHKQTVVFGAALMYDESCASFQFVFRAFLNAMSGKEPTTILSDQDKAMAQALSVVMPNTHHRICVWHMHQNAVKHLSDVYSCNKSFTTDFNECIYDHEEEVDFLDAWERMLEKYDLRNNIWLQKLFDEREKWALAYRRNTFCADMKSTQRNESMNSVIRMYLDCSHSLLQFFPQWEKLVADRRKAEGEADFKMTQSTPLLLMNVPILVGARNMYTPEIFKLFQEEYENGMSCTATIICTVGTVVTYKVHSLKKSREYIVTYDSWLHTVECCCKKFEFSGILCGHALRVLDHADLVEVPDRYILKRWRKDAKISTVNISDIASKGKMDSSTRYRDLICTSVNVSSKAAITSEAYAFAMDGMNRILKGLDHFQIDPTATSASQCIPPHGLTAHFSGSN